MTVEPLDESAESRAPRQAADGDAEIPEGEVNATPATAHADPAADGTGDFALDELQEQLAKSQDRLLRALAEQQNLQKRMERERNSYRATYTAAPLREFLAVIDNLDRALESDASPDDFRAGVEMIRRLMSDLLRRFDVEPVESLNRPFDPNLHQAVARTESAAVDEPTVTAELQKGYTIGSRLLREAMVQVAVPAAGVGDAETEPDAGS